MYRTKDGWIIVQVASQSLFKRWARMMGEEFWLVDERFKDDHARLSNGDILNERMARWCAERTNAQALVELDKAALPAGPVLSPQEVLDHEQVRAIGAFQEISYPGVPVPAPLLKTPVQFSQTPATIRTSPPQIGEHTDSILTELGYSPTQIDAMHHAGTV
jgi:crotonobetainyl-CoA:carnitine CoA-transferase CaiB-like acyl-CoA transferase